MSTAPATPSEIDDEDARFWLREIEAAKDRNDHWYTKAKEAIDRYEDEGARAFGKLNILWANVEVQKAALGEDFGDPQVNRLNAPSNQVLTRHISRIWEQSIDASVKDTNDNYEIREAVHDVLLPGRGQVWLELNPTKDDEGNVIWVEAPLVHLDYKDYLEGPAKRWQDVPWVARGELYTLDDLKKLLPEDRLAEADSIPRNYSLPVPKSMKDDQSEESKEQFKRAMVWEVWAKFPQKRRIYIAEGHDKALKVDPDPYGLKRFFPCPRPMIANGSACQPPLTDYSRYQDQAEEIDRLSERIFVLTDVLRRRGIHDKQFKQLGDLALAGDNVNLAIENWADLQQKGGLNKVIEWEDLTPTITVLGQLHKDRQTLIQMTYELTGISDLARGMTDPDETLGAQMLKKTYGSGRFQSRQKESRRFAADAYALKAEVIAENFPRHQIQEMSGIAIPTMAEKQRATQQLQQMQQLQQRANQARQQLAQLQQGPAQQQPGQPPVPAAPPPSPQQIAQLQQLARTPPFDLYQVQDLQEIANAPCTWEKVSSILQSDKRRCYMVEVETDQTAFRDEDADKKARIELLGVINNLMKEFGPMIAGNPANGDFFKKLIMFVVSSFKVGRSMEEGLEQTIDAAIQQAIQQSQQQKQNPAMQADAAKAQADMAKAQADMAQADAKVKTAQLGIQEAQIRLQQSLVEAQKAGADIQSEAFMARLKAFSERSKIEAKGLEGQAKAQEAQRKIIEGQTKIQQQEMANEAKRRGHQIDLQNKAEKAAFERATRASADEALRYGPTRAPDNVG